MAYVCIILEALNIIWKVIHQRRWYWPWKRLWFIGVKVHRIQLIVVFTVKQKLYSRRIFLILTLVVEPENYNNSFFSHFISDQLTMKVEPMSKFWVLDLGFIIGFKVGCCRFRPKFHLLSINSEFYRCSKISSLQWSYELVSLWPKKSKSDFKGMT